MLLTLMAYVTAVSFVLGCAAWALEHGVRGLAFPTRWIWSVALIGSFGFGLVTLFLETFLGTLAASGAAGASAIILTPVVVSLGRVTASVAPFRVASSRLRVPTALTSKSSKGRLAARS